MRPSLRHMLISSFCVFSMTQAQSSYRALPGSKLWLDGSSSVNTFSCSTVQVNGTASFENGIPEVSVQIAVRTLNCGNDGMNDDMYHAMKTKEYPFITYVLRSTDSVAVDPQTGEIHLVTAGELTIAGSSENVEIPITVTPSGRDRYRVRGTKPLSMHEFHITPPSAFFGLIQAHDLLIVNFDITVEKSSDGKLEFMTKAGGK
jgi:polyisoprenoid-binding protein YceI